MAYTDRYGSTTLRKDKIDHLSIAWDYDDDESDKFQRFPVFLFTPDMDNTNNHFHIPLNREQALVLRFWLEDFLKETGPIDFDDADPAKPR